jgi:hypothetical protein
MTLLRSRLALIAGLTLTATAFSASAARAELIYGLTTTNGLFTFDSAAPASFSSLTGAAGSVTAISGLTTNDVLESIDFRPSTNATFNGTLYGLGRNGTSLRLYTINAVTGVVTSTTTLSLVAGGATTPAASFLAANYAIDFNPMADALRIINDGGQNFRISGANLNTLTGQTFTDFNLSQTGVSGAAYTNNVPGPTVTTLFDINPTTDTLLLQSPPNNGTLTAVGAGLGQNVVLGDLDISGITGNAYYGGGNSFYTINTTTGVASAPAAFGGGLNVRGIAAPIGAAPEPGTFALLGLGLLGGTGMVLRRRARK